MNTCTISSCSEVIIRLDTDPVWKLTFEAQGNTLSECAWTHADLSGQYPLLLVY